MSPVRLHRLLARSEAVTWALLLLGMFLKYVTETTELAVRVFGMAHGVVFIAYCLVTGMVWIDQKWSFGRFAAGIACAIPPFATLPFEASLAKHSLLSDAWRLRAQEPVSPLEKLVAFLVRKPWQGAAVGVVAVVGLTGVALLVGPPA